MLVPFFAYVILEREKLKSKGGLIIPESAEKRNAPAKGVVVSVGPTAEDEIKKLVGKTVIFKRHAGDWMTAPGGEEFYVVQEEDILAEVRNG